MPAGAAAAALAGCGGQARRQPEPRLSPPVASQLVTLARRVERDAPTDGCAARHEIALLSTRAHALVDAGRVPARLRAPLLAGVAAVAAEAPACTPPPPAPAPTPAPAPAPVVVHGNAHGHDKPGHEGHGHGHGQGHGHGDGNDQGD